MVRPNYLCEIRQRTLNKKMELYLYQYFAYISENSKIVICLSILESEKVLRCIMRGVYNKPE